MMKYFVPLFSLCLTLLLFTSCETDPCDSLDCGTNGACVEGVCACDTFYEGENCELERREKYIGTWTGDFVCGNGPSATGIIFEITPGVEVSTIRIQSSQIYSNVQFLGTLLISGFGEEGVEIERFQVGINGYSGFMESIGENSIRMTIIAEQTGDACVFSLAR